MGQKAHMCASLSQRRTDGTRGVGKLDSLDWRLPPGPVGRPFPCPWALQGNDKILQNESFKINTFPTRFLGANSAAGGRFATGSYSERGNSE